MDTAEQRPFLGDGCFVCIQREIESIRQRPGMYVGDVHNGSGLHYLMSLLIYGLLDQHIDQRYFHLGVTLHRDGGVTLEDDGPGPPSKPSEMIPPRVMRRREPAWELALPCARALSETMHLELRRNGQLYTQTYARGKCVAPLACQGPARGNGTRIQLRADPEIFDSVVFDGRHLESMLRDLAFLNPDFRIALADERAGRRTSFHGQGIAAWVERLCEGQSTFPQEPVVLQGKYEGGTIQAAFQWRHHPGSHVRGLVNIEHVPFGIHVDGLVEGLAQALKNTARALEPTPMKCAPERLARDLVAIVDLRCDEVQFEGSTRERVVGDAAKEDIRRVICEEMSRYFRFRSDVFKQLYARVAAP